MGLLSNTTVRIVFSQFQTISANWRIADDTEFQFGSDADFNIQFDQANDYLQIDNGTIDILTLSDTRLTLLSDLRLLYTGSTGYLGTIGANPLILQTNSTNALTIDSSQNVTIAGVVAPLRVDVGTMVADSTSIEINTNDISFYRNNTSYINNKAVGGYIRFRTSTATENDTNSFQIEASKVTSFVNHDFSAGIDVTGTITTTNGIEITKVNGHIELIESDAITDEKIWFVDANAGQFRIFGESDGGGTYPEVLIANRVGATIDSVVYGNATDTPLHTFHGQQVANDTIQITSGSARGSGTGIEIGYYTGAPIGEILVYDRDLGNYKDIVYSALSHSFKANGTEKVNIDSSGNVVITGTTLQHSGGTFSVGVDGSTTSQINLFSDNASVEAGQITLHGSTDGINFSTLDWYIDRYTNDIRWVYGSNILFRLSSVGGIGIPQDGSSSDDYLYVGAGEDLKIYHDGSDAYLLSSGDSSVLRLQSDAHVMIDIDVTGNQTGRTFQVRANGSTIIWSQNEEGNIGLVTTDVQAWGTEFNSIDGAKSSVAWGVTNEQVGLWSNLYYNASATMKIRASSISASRLVVDEDLCKYEFDPDVSAGADRDATLQSGFQFDGTDKSFGIPIDYSGGSGFIYAGAGKDFKIYHDGSTNWIDGTPSLWMRAVGASSDMVLVAGRTMYLRAGSNLLIQDDTGSTTIAVLDGTDGVTVDDSVDFGIGTYYEVSTGTASVQGLRNTGLFSDTYTSSAIQSIASAPSIRHKQEIDVIFEFYMDNAWTGFTVCAVYLDASVDGGTTWTQVATSTVANGVGNLALLTHDVSANTSLSVSDVNSDLSYRARIVVTGGTGTGSFRVRNYTSAGTVTGTYAVWKRHPTSSDDIWNG